MGSKAKALYDGTARRIPSLHRLARALAWKGGALAVGILSRLLRFDFPQEELLPFYQLALLLGTYESETVRRYRALLREGAVVFDVGAHAGYHTLRFARLVGTGGRVYAFEPHPRTAALLRRNVARRKLSQVRVSAQAVGAAPGAAMMHESALSMGHSLLPLKSYTGRVEVSATSLDRYAEGQGIARADLVKIDVEGAELEVLEGMRALAARSPELAVIVEFKPSLLRARSIPATRLPEQLASLGLASMVIGPRGHLLPLPVGSEELAALGTCNLLARRARSGRDHH